MSSKKVGLALGGGAVRGLAHIGVLAVLEKEGIPIDLIVGTSAGAIVGSLYARERDASQIKRQLIDLAQQKLTRFIDPALPRTGLIKGKKIKDLLASFMGGDIKFSHLRIPFACVATDIDSGEEVVIDRGSVPEAVRASISIPALFTVVKRGGRYLVDGGLVSPVPVDLAKRMGADFVIAVNVIPDVADRVHRVTKEGMKDFKAPNIIHIVMQSIYVGTSSLVRSNLEGADIVIEPKVAHIGAGDFHHAEECIRQGELAAQSSIPEIKRKLEALS
ncbi:MAG: patatin-like phospholipase family protein [Dehalococcoidales bacterium]